MALGIWGLLIALAAPAAAQTTLGAGEVQILPRVDGTDTGSLRLRELNANGQDAVRISAPSAISSGGYRVRMPGAQGTGALTNDGSGNLSWGNVGLQYWTEGDGSPDPLGSLLPASSLTQNIGNVSAFVNKMYIKDVEHHSTGSARWGGAPSSVFTIDGSTATAVDAFGATTAQLTYSSGTMTALVFNMTGSAYRVSGQTAIDSLRNGRFTNAYLSTPDVVLDINQTNGLTNSAGTIVFNRFGTPLGKIESDFFDGIKFYTSLSAATPNLKWVIGADGHLRPGLANTYDVGTLSYPVYRSYTNRITAIETFGFATLPRIEVLTYGGITRALMDLSALTLYNASGSQTVQADSGTGTVTAAVFNATGSGFRINGTTVIDSTKTIRAADVFPDGDATRDLGATSLRYNRAYISNIEASAQVAVIASGVVRVNASGSGLQVYNSFGALVFSAASLTGNVSSSGTISATSGFISGGSSGITAVCTGGQTIRNPQFLGGILVAGSCGL